jgi:hypothetical protein
VIVNKLPEEKPGNGQEAELPEQPKDEYDTADDYERTDTE